MILSILKSEKNSSILIETDKIIIADIPGKKISNDLLNYIGRLRAEVFLKNSDITHDIDGYDQYFNHLICVDKENDKIISYCRMGVVKYIYQEFGKEGFYISSIYDVDDSLYKIIGNKSIEVGRVLINPEYKNHPHAIKYLWQGYVLFLNKYDCDRFYGTIFINNTYSEASFKLISNFLKTNFNKSEFNDIIKPKNQVLDSPTDISDELNEIFLSIRELKQQLKVIENKDVDIPSLIRHYINWTNVQYLGAGGIPEGIDTNTVVLVCTPNQNAYRKFGL